MAESGSTLTVEAWMLSFPLGRPGGGSGAPNLAHRSGGCWPWGWR